MGTSIAYQSRCVFPALSTDSILKQKPVKAGVPVLNSWFYSDNTQNNYRLIEFVAGSGVFTNLKIVGQTIFNTMISEVLALDGNIPVRTVNAYKYFQVIPEEDVETLSIGRSKGMTEIIAYDGAPTTHRVIVTGSGTIQYTVYGLLTLESLTKAQLDAQKFAVSSDLTNENATTPTFVLVTEPASKLFLEISELDPDISLEWQFNTQSLL